MLRSKPKLLATSFALTLLSFASALAAESDSLANAADRLRQLVPRHANSFTTEQTESLIEAAGQIDRRTVDFTDELAGKSPSAIIERIGSLCDVKNTIEATLDELLQRRTQFAELEPGEERRERLRNFLQSATQLIELSGRIQYQLADAINLAAYQFAGQPERREELIDRLIVSKSGIGAAIMSWALLDPPPNSPNRAQAASTATKLKILAIIRWSGRLDTLPVLAEFLKAPRVAPELAIAAAETVRHIGLPQPPRPGGESTLPPPAITPDELRKIVGSIETQSLSRDLKRRHAELLRWLDRRIEFGAETDGFRIGYYDVLPGDWLLMRNSSPYNLFTDLSPGLFTHVSVVARERSSDGLERLVVVEVAERGTRVPANNVEGVLNVPLYYVFLRHRDPAVRERMAETAAAVIGNELEYDLTFDTTRLAELVEKPLKGETIRTYCAGLPLLCALKAGRSRDELFPIEETPASDKLVENMSRLGIRFGDRFVSPTGSVFSAQMQIVGRSEPMYTPGREIEQGIYDYTIAQLSQQDLMPRPNLFQSLRQALAGASRTNPLLARALASAAGVDADIDLATAARTATVIETLDQIATQSRDGFADAAAATLGPDATELAALGRTPIEIERIMTLRKHYADLRRRSLERELSTREVIEVLIEDSMARGRRQVDERFFSGSVTNAPP